jgi:hypothetical protein
LSYKKLELVLVEAEGQTVILKHAPLKKQVKKEGEMNKHTNREKIK